MTKFKHADTASIIQNQYLSFSFFASLLIWMGSYLLDEHPFTQNFFLSSLLMGNFYFYYFGYGLVGASKLFVFPAYFLFQTLCLIGASFEQMSIGPLYMSLIPCAAGLYHFISRDIRSNREHFAKGVSLGVIALLAYLSVSGILHRGQVNEKEAFYIGGFVFWFSGIIFWGIRLAFKENRSLFHHVLKKQQNMLQEDNDSKDRYFFHDLINMTHGLNLYLGQKVSQGKGLEYNEVKSLRSEVKLIQTLTKDHFNLKHKNLFATYEIVTFDFAKEFVKKLVKSYLPEHLVDCHFVFKGTINENVETLGENDNFVHFPSLYRIINNLVKNMAEDRTTEAEFVFDYRNEGLVLTAKNKVFKLRDDHKNLAENLSEMIMSGDRYSSEDKANGLGLKSIASLCIQLGGEFSFSLEDGYWVNRIFLPRITNEKARSEAHKKVA